MFPFLPCSFRVGVGLASYVPTFHLSAMSFYVVHQFRLSYAF